MVIDMALIKCVECGKEISDTTDICVHCGAPTSISTKRNDNVVTKSKRNNKRNIVIFIVVCLLVFCIVIIGVPFFINLRNKDILASDTLDAEYSAPELEYIYGDAMRVIFEFKDDGTAIYQRCNTKTDACADPHSYTYKKYGLDVDIYGSDDNLLYDCSLKNSGKILNCYDMSGQYQDYAKTN